MPHQSVQARSSNSRWISLWKEARQGYRYWHWSPWTLWGNRVVGGRCFRSGILTWNSGESFHHCLEHVRKVLENKDTRALFAKPNEPSIVWREQTFSLLADGELVNGVFDRVVLRQDAACRWLSAEIIDYKTDRDIKNDDDLEMGAGRHRKQLEFNRKARSSNTGLPAEKITLKIVFTTIPSTFCL